MNIDELFDRPPRVTADIIGPIPPEALFNKCLRAADANGFLHELAAGSYQHENGFTKLYLGSCAQGRLKVRAHYWPARAGDSASNVHNHRFSFTSHVLRGHLNHTVYRETPVGREFNHYKYKPRLASTEYVLEYLRTALLDKVSETTLATGTIYDFASTDLHTSEPVGDQRVITLFVEDRSTLSDTCDVYSMKYPPRTLTLDAPALEPAEWKKSLANLISAL